MRWPGMVVLVAATLAITAGVWFASGGRAVFLFLPLLIGLPLLVKRRG